MYWRCFWNFRRRLWWITWRSLWLRSQPPSRFRQTLLSTSSSAPPLLCSMPLFLRTYTSLNLIHGLLWCLQVLSPCVFRVLVVCIWSSIHLNFCWFNSCLHSILARSYLFSLMQHKIRCIHKLLYFHLRFFWCKLKIFCIIYNYDHWSMFYIICSWVWSSRDTKTPRRPQF